jgi:hypothetical protein
MNVHPGTPTRAFPDAAALSYAQHGLRVFPLWPAVPTSANGPAICACGKSGCASPGKHPLALKGGAPNGLRDASCDLKVVESWWYRWPEANIGLATDPFVVADVDPRHNGVETMRKLVERYGPLPPTWRVHTGGGGLHIYFKPPKGVEISSGANRLGPGIDIRARGGYVVAPPSNHLSGKRYRWHIDVAPLDQPLADLPASMCDGLQQQQEQHRAAPAAEWISILANDLPEGQRDATITRLAGLLLRRRIEPQIVELLLLPFNEVHCKPPLPLADIRKIINSIWRRERLRRG